MNTMEFEVRRTAKRSEDWVLLCYLPNNSVTPWVTWSSATPTGISGQSCGHYFDDAGEALADFDERAGRRP
jgi:hypothetical protein